MESSYFRTVLGYSYWARDRILAQVAKVSQEDYTAAPWLDYSSMRATLVHGLGSEAGYLARWQGGERDASINEEGLPTFAALRDRWTAEQAKMQAFLASLTDADTEREIRQLSRATGQETSSPLWALMTQCVNHATQHRSEVALMLTQLGHSPGDMDFSLYMREQK